VFPFLPNPLPQRSKAYRPEIDGLRALAVLAVLVNHLDPAWLPGGFLGVDIFFVISGYVVTSSLLVRKDPSPLAFLGWFYQRRFRRLLPALIVNVVVVGLLFAMVASPGDDLTVPTLRTGIAALFGVSNLYLLRQGLNYFATDNHYNAFMHTWSLGVEEQFYLVWPVVLLLCGVGLSGPAVSLRRLKWVSLLLMVISLAFFLLLSLRGQHDKAFFLTPARFWELAAGSLAYLAHRGSGSARDLGERLSIQAYRGSLGAGLLVAMAGMLLLSEQHRVLTTLAIPLLTAALLILVQQASAVGHLLSHPVSVAIGKLSYSLYLWHWPVIVLARWTVGIVPWTMGPILVVTALLTLLSYQLETRFRYGQPSAGARIQPLFLYPILSLGGAALLFALQGPASGRLFAGDRGRDPAATSNMKRIQGTTVNTVNCFVEPIAPINQGDVYQRCRANASPGRATLYFEGDSHSHALIPLGEKILATGRWNVAFYGRGGCPFPWFEPRANRSDQSERYRLCRPHVEIELIRVLPALRPGDQLVLVSKLPGYLKDLVHSQRLEAEASYSQALQRIARSARARGAGVILFAPLPSFVQEKITGPLSLCQREWFRPAWAIPVKCRPVTQSRSEQIQYVQPIRSLLMNLADRTEGVVVFDPFDSICPPDQSQCSTHRKGELLFSDGNHLTNAGAVSLHPRFKMFLERLQNPAHSP
jgi:peptidoglycan/LPS O-acetylase OafA/YrhL